MAKFNKAFIPLGISGIFVSLSLVGGLAVTSTMITRYVPEEIVVEGAGGTDETASNPEELNTQLGKVKIYTGNYYASLKDLETDPEPTPDMYNSIALTCVGGDSTFNRKLVVTQNHLGAFYQYDGYRVSGGVKTTQNMLISFSRHGMFIKFNSYELTAESEEVTIAEENRAIERGIMKNRGNWYEVACSKELSAEIAMNPMSLDIDALCEYSAVMIASNISSAWYDGFKNDLNSNEGLLTRLCGYLTNPDLEETSQHYYRLENYFGVEVRLDLSNSSKPVFNLSTTVVNGENETITIEHINNTKVRIVEKSEIKGDFYDLFGKPVMDYYKEQYAEMGEAAQQAMMGGK